MQWCNQCLGSPVGEKSLGSKSENPICMRSAGRLRGRHPLNSIKSQGQGQYRRQGRHPKVKIDISKSRSTYQGQCQGRYIKSRGPGQGRRQFRRQRHVSPPSTIGSRQRSRSRSRVDFRSLRRRSRSTPRPTSTPGEGRGGAYTGLIIADDSYIPGLTVPNTLRFSAGFRHAFGCLFSS